MLRVNTFNWSTYSPNKIFRVVKHWNFISSSRSWGDITTSISFWEFFAFASLNLLRNKRPEYLKETKIKIWHKLYPDEWENWLRMVNKIHRIIRLRTLISNNNGKREAKFLLFFPKNIQLSYYVMKSEDIVVTKMFWCDISLMPYDWSSNYFRWEKHWSHMYF